MNILPGNLISPSIKYTVRQSIKAQRACLRIIPGKGLELVLPLHYPLKEVPRIMSLFLPWINKNKQRCLLPPTHPVLLPHLFSLYGKTKYYIAIRINKNMQIINIDDMSHGLSVKKIAHTKYKNSAMYLPKITDKEQHKLTLWLRQTAQKELGAILCNLAEVHGFKYTSCTIRMQKTRWGSCSRKGSINLNAKLLFLPISLIRYVLLHELCHLRHFNHGADFWNLLVTLEPQAKTYRKQLHNAWNYIPDWC